MLVDTLFDRLVGRFRRSRHQQYDEDPPIPHQGDMGPQKRDTGQHGSGSFKGAHNFTVNDPTFIERAQVIQYFAAGNPGFDPVLEHITTYANLDATMDSSARHPPPLCHPGTRLKIGDRLFNWLIKPNREWNMIWLHGPAGTGKSAVAQTFAERCSKNYRLGASFFFSRLYNCNDPNTVVPSLVYQLAVCNPEYKSLVAAQLTNDPELLRRKTQRTQFTKLIIEPFSFLQTRGGKVAREPLLVVLDGLDECKGESAQREIIEMISDVVQLKKDFPLVWLVCSRPEEHLKCIFSRADFTVNCGREELTIDAESVADVNFYLQDGLAGIKADFRYVTNPMWPSEEQIARLSEKASGHFGFASISLRYIGDPMLAAPVAQLDALLSFFRGIRAGTSSPLNALDALYAGILRDVPDEDLPTVQLILGYRLYGSSLYPHNTQSACNFLCIDQMTFYNVFRKLHSVINIPSPEAACKTPLKFYHLSFSDYLQDPSRSGRFAIEKESAFLQSSKLCLSWYKIDLELFHATDGPVFNESHEHGILPGLKWTSDDNREEISRAVATSVASQLSWMSCIRVTKWDEALLSQIRNFDIQSDGLANNWCFFVNKLWGTSLDGFIRAEPQSEFDLRLLEYMESMTKSYWRSRPAALPLRLRKKGRGGYYFFLGHGAKAVVCWTTGLELHKPLFGLLRGDKAPSEKQIFDYYVWLTKEGAVKENDITTELGNG